jgi:hypothetical protein
MDSYDTAWQEYRKRRNIGWLIFLGYVPGVMLVVMLTSPLVHSFVPGFVAAGVWMVGAVVWGNYTIRWKCPRCQRPFFATWWHYNSFARKCVHCGLHKWSSDSTHP